MPVSLLVCARFELGDVRAHAVLGELDHHVRPAATALLPFVKLNRVHVRDEVGLERAATVEPSFTSKVIVCSRKAIGEGKRIAEDEVDAVEEAEHRRQVGDRGVACGLAA